MLLSQPPSLPNNGRKPLEIEMLDVEMTAARAAQYLQDNLSTGLSYGHLLADMRRGRRSRDIPHHHNEKGWAMYYRTDLDAFIASKKAGIIGPRHDYLVEREGTALASWFEPDKRISPVMH